MRSCPPRRLAATAPNVNLSHMMFEVHYGIGLYVTNSVSLFHAEIFFN